MGDYTLPSLDCPISLDYSLPNWVEDSEHRVDIWREVCSISSNFNTGIKYSVHMGADILFSLKCGWDLGDDLLKVRFPRIYIVDAETNARVFSWFHWHNSVTFRSVD